MKNFDWSLVKPETDWSQTDLPSHRTAWDRAKAEFVRDMGHAPACSSDISAIARRAEAIRQERI